MINVYIAFVHSHISYAADLELNEWILQNKDMYFLSFQLYKNFSTLPPKLHEQQILYTFT